MNPLQLLQNDVVNYALGNPETALMPVTAFRKMVVESVQDEAAAAWQVRVDGKVGVAALVLMPAVTSKYGNVPGPQYETELTIRVFEDPTANNTGLSGEDAALSLLRWLDGLIIEGLTELYPSVKGPALRPNYDFPGFLVHDVVLEGELPQEMVGRTIAPEFAEAEGLLSLSCPEAGAEIFFTTDGTAPVPGVLGQLYVEPIPVANGDVVRAVSWLATKLPSHVARGTIKIP